MSVSTAGCIRALIASVLIGVLSTPLDLVAADHVVRPAEIQKAIVARAQERQANLSLVEGFFSRGPAARALQSVPTVRGLVDRAVPRLDDQELAQLAAKVGRIQRDFEAGSLTNQQLTYIVIALATAVIVLILVET
jgi:ABC-type ATPase with predicted acetyltransferase domain